MTETVSAERKDISEIRNTFGRTWYLSHSRHSRIIVLISISLSDRHRHFILYRRVVKPGVSRLPVLLLYSSYLCGTESERRRRLLLDLVDAVAFVVAAVEHQ